jgi:hypothetical protein
MNVAPKSLCLYVDPSGIFKPYWMVVANGEPLTYLVVRVGRCTSIEEVLRSGEIVPQDIQDALRFTADTLAGIRRIPVAAYSLFLAQPWISHRLTPNVAGLRGKPTRITTLLRRIADRMDIARIVEELHLEKSDRKDHIYCGLNYASDVVQFVPRALAREAKEKEELERWREVERSCTKAPPASG